MNTASVAVAIDAVVVRRTIAASAEDLFDAWLDPQALGAWMRPGEIHSTVATLDARVGGRYEIVMHGATEQYPHSGVYRVIDRPRRLVFTWISRGTEQQESLVTVDFLARGQRTEVVVTHEKLPESARPSHTNGWTSGLSRLDEAVLQGTLK
ncbi:MAG: SRPBCC domain-containing protein [Pseudomonadota bacterium]